jgi:uncharacterized membrane protein YvlD (DUF360 family)
LIRRLPEVFAFILVCAAILLVIHQQIISNDRLFNLHQMWHHETLIAAFLFGAVCLIIGKYLGRTRR